MPPKSPVREIKIRVVGEGKGELKKIAKGLGVINKSTKSTAKSLRGFSNAFKATFAGIGVRELVRASDQFQLLKDRIAAFEGSAEKASKVFNDLGKVAAFSNTSTASLAESYNRLALSMKDLNIESDAVLGTTLALQQTFRISGSTIAETTGAVIQLSQGLSAGALRGQELRSVMESNSILAGLLAKEFGVARGQLIKLAETGAITSDRVLKVLANDFENLNDQAAKIKPTIGQSVVIALDVFKRKLLELNEEFGVSGKFNKGMKAAIKNLGFLTQATLTFGAALTVLNLVNRRREMIGFVKGLLSMKNLWVASAAAISLFVAKYNTDDIFKAKTQVPALKAGIAIKKATNAIIGFGASVAKNVPLLQSLFGKEMLADAQFGLGVVLNKSVTDMRKQLVEAQRVARGGLKETEDEFTSFINSIGKALDDAASKMSKGAGLGANTLGLLNFRLSEGIILMDEYNDGINQIAIDKLESDFNRGKISVEAYASGLSKIPDAIDGITIAQSLLGDSVKKSSDVLALSAGLLDSTFKGLEDSMVEFATNGKFVWRDFANDIIKQIVRIQIRAAIVAPLLKLLTGGGLASMFTPTASASGFDFVKGASMPTPDFSAKGNAYSGGGALSVFGEAGPEAILPLTRGSGGELGVKSVGGGGGTGVTVNVFNSNGSNVETKESTGADGKRQIDVMITGAVKSMFASGAMDRQMNTNYGLSRKGT